MPRLDVWDCPLLRDDSPLGIGRTEKHVGLRSGPWTIALAIDSGARYPPYEDVVPRPTARVTRLTLPLEDVKRLLRELPRLPGRQEEHATVLLSLGDRITVVGQGQDGRGELDLPGAQFTGPPVRVACDRRQLLRALRLGFTAVNISSPDKPLFCRDDRRTYVFMPVTWERR